MKWVLLVTWLVPQQPPNSYQVQFATAGLCNEAANQVRADAARIEAWAKANAPILFPVVSATCDSFAQSRHVAVIHGQIGKSQFAQDCVVGLRGLEPSAKRL